MNIKKHNIIMRVGDILLFTVRRENIISIDLQYQNIISLDVIIG